ncbi:hypothetical protein AB0C61_25450 [Streptomyces sp. NPDC048680]|uniref:hypothetical protein n=1 Tax=Streptomyces sp. NPDC048680 TaxID=3155492 RepID=UPI0034357A96
MLPYDFPPPAAVKHYFRTWRDDGTVQTIHDLLSPAGAGNGEHLEVEVVEPNSTQTGLVTHAERWVVECAQGILMLHRRLVREDGQPPCGSELRAYRAIAAVLLRRLTGATTPAQSRRTNTPA